MWRMGFYDSIKSAMQDVIAPALHELRGDIVAMRGEMQGMRTDIQRVDQKIDNVDARLSDKIDSLAAQMGHMRGELIAEIRRVDARIDGVDRELRTAIDIRERLAALEARRP
jgi:predicted  nucleic acid-binding Zn-ribbon protein